MSVAVGVLDLQTIDTSYLSTSLYQWYHGSVPLGLLHLLATNNSTHDIYS